MLRSRSAKEDVSFMTQFAENCMTPVGRLAGLPRHSKRSSVLQRRALAQVIRCQAELQRRCRLHNMICTSPALHIEQLRCAQTRRNQCMRKVRCESACTAGVLTVPRQRFPRRHLLPPPANAASPQHWCSPAQHLALATPPRRQQRSSSCEERPEAAPHPPLRSAPSSVVPPN